MIPYKSQSIFLWKIESKSEKLVKEIMWKINESLSKVNESYEKRSHRNIYVNESMQVNQKNILGKKCLWK